MKLLMILVRKGTCAPAAPPLKGQGVQCPRNAPRSGVPVSHQAFTTKLCTWWWQKQCFTLPYIILRRSPVHLSYNYGDGLPWFGQKEGVGRSNEPPQMLGETTCCNCAATMHSASQTLCFNTEICTSTPGPDMHWVNGHSWFLRYNSQTWRLLFSKIRRGNPCKRSFRKVLDLYWSKR